MTRVAICCALFLACAIASVKGTRIAHGERDTLAFVHAAQATDAPQLSDGTLLAGGLQSPREIRLSTLGTLYLAETARHRLLTLHASGQRLDSLGRLGSGDYQFDTPVAVDPTNELRIYVADRGNRRIQVFDRRMQYLSTVQIPSRTGLSEAYEPVLMSVDNAGRLYFYDALQQRVHRLNTQGQYDLHFELIEIDERITPAAMQAVGDQLWVAALASDMLHRFSLSGGWIGFVPVHEPVVALRKRHGSLWVLGTRHLIEFDVRGNELRRMPLPYITSDTDHQATAAQKVKKRPRLFGLFRRGERLSTNSSTILWRSFDIGESHVYLINTTELMRWSLPVSDHIR